jgi:hypothetical protein
MIALFLLFFDGACEAPAELSLPKQWIHHVRCVLALSPEQDAQIAALQSELAVELHLRQATMEQAREQLAQALPALLSGDALDRRALEQASRPLRNAWLENWFLVRRTNLQVIDLLRSEQIEALNLSQFQGHIPKQTLAAALQLRQTMLAARQSGSLEGEELADIVQASEQLFATMDLPDWLRSNIAWWQERLVGAWQNYPALQKSTIPLPVPDLALFTHAFAPAGPLWRLLPLPQSLRNQAKLRLAGLALLVSASN